MSLFDKLRQRTATVGVIGLGYVGFPLAVEFARAGFPTIGIDIDKERVQQLQAGRGYIPDVSDETVGPLVRSGRLTATTNYSYLVPEMGEELHQTYDHILGKLVNMITHPSPWVLRRSNQ